MKEIKFRAWLKATNEMVDVKSIHFESKVIRYNDLKNKQIRCAGFENIELMQYTGLKDKNGKEIYEGDVVPVWENGEEYLYKVVYDGDCFMLAMLDSEQGSYPLSVKCKHTEIIGNIYENKELLEE